MDIHPIAAFLITTTVTIIMLSYTVYKARHERRSRIARRCLSRRP